MMRMMMMNVVTSSASDVTMKSRGHMIFVHVGQSVTLDCQFHVFNWRQFHTFDCHWTASSTRPSSACSTTRLSGRRLRGTRRHSWTSWVTSSSRSWTPVDSRSRSLWTRLSTACQSEYVVQQLPFASSSPPSHTIIIIIILHQFSDELYSAERLVVCA